MLSAFWKDKKALLTFVILAGFFVWWWFLHFGHQENTGHILDWWAGTYGIIALVGGVWGLVVSKRWGGFKSVIGLSVAMFSFGLLAQEFGQLIYAYYAIVDKIEVPYPSIGDIGYFGSVLLYIYGTFLLAKAAGAKFSLKTVSGKFQAVIIPITLLITSYLLFLRGYEFDWRNPLTVILDFGYPLGQAIYISIAILAFLLSRKMLGGIMRKKILLIIFALCAQYAADFNFLLQSSHETWSTAQYGDFLYALSYTLMTIALLSVGLAYAQIRNTGANHG